VLPEVKELGPGLVSREASEGARLSHYEQFPLQEAPRQATPFIAPGFIAEVPLAAGK
jgi:hypothetical protein